MKLNIATKINLLTVSLIVIFTSFLGWFFVRHETSAIKTELDERAITIVNNIAYNSEYDVLVGDKEGLIRLLEGIIREKDISYARIEGVTGNLIAEVGEKEKVLIKEFTAPIVAIQLSKDAGKEELSIIQEIEKGKEKKLGMVRLGVSLRGLYQKTTQIKKVMLLSVIVIILISSLVVIFAVRFLISRPLKPLMLGVEKIRTGDLSHRVKIKSRDELGEFANSFNKMTENLSKVTVSKDYVDNIIKSMIDTLIVTDPNGNIRTVNKATEELLGYKEDELIGKPVRILFAEEETLSKGTKWEKLLNEGSVRNYEMTYRTKNGENIPVTFSGSVMKDKDGNLVGIVGIARDMREIKQLQSQVIQSSKLAAIGELASGLAHELGNPLQTILGNADLLLIDNLGSEELMAIKNASVYSKKIIEGLLDFSRQRELKFVCGDINTVIEKTLLLYGKQLELKKVKIAKNYAQLPPILISPPHLEQVFLNLITNAQSAMPEGGTLTISTNVVARPWRVEKEAIQGIATTKENKIEHIEISFKDTGSGISKENLNRIFEPFFTTKKDGTGLGLSISYGIVKQHGGEIVAFSDGEGKGTEFVVKLSTGGGGG